MKVLQISAECYPAAKAGGLGDVVGALPKYLNQQGVETAVVIPMYRTKWITQQKWQAIFGSKVRQGDYYVPFQVLQFESTPENDLGFPLYVVDIPGRFDREGVYIDSHTGYGYNDEVERALCFQQAVLTWLKHSDMKVDVLHCHDHHTGLIPFMIKHAHEYKSLGHLPTVFTIHNGEYSGAFHWKKGYLLPYFDHEARGLLDWSNVIHPLACAIKCCWKLTTVSKGYLNELQRNAQGITWLLNHERPKSKGILNGIDTNVWNPKTDKYLPKKLGRSIDQFKDANKKAVLQHFRLDENRPLITFIGRLVGEKGAQLLPSIITNFLNAGGNASFAILGTGDPNLHRVFSQMRQQYAGRFDVALEYNEGLAHQLYAGSDYLLMPSKVEPCGLNQMYALRYGTIPIVRAVGGLRDTITDIGNKDGNGIRFDHFSVPDAFNAVRRASQVYDNPKVFKAIRKAIMKQDFSWEKSARIYKEMYESLV